MSIKAAYKNEATGLRVVIKKIFALAFLEQLPALDSAFGEAALDLMFNILKAELLALQSPLVPLDALNSFIFYFESKWMSCREDWNLFNFDDHRASNDLEMWHVNMNQAINRKDNLWKFIKSLTAEQALREGEVNKIISGHDAPPQRRSQKQKEEVIAAAKADYSSRRISALEYVNRLSYRMGH